MAENRVTNLSAEVLRTGAPNARVTVVAAEVLNTGAARARVTSLAAEVLVPNTTAVNGTANGVLLTVASSIHGTDVFAPARTVTATISLIAGEAGEAVAVDGTRIFEFSAGISDAAVYGNADFDSIWSIGDRINNGLATAGIYGHPSAIFGAPSQLYDMDFSFPTGNGLTYSGGSPLPSWAHWVDFGGWGLDVRGFRLRGSPSHTNPDFFAFVGGIGVAAYVNESYAQEFDYFMPQQPASSSDSHGLHFQEYLTTPRYPVPWPHYEFVFPTATALTETFANEVEFKVAHSSLDGGDRRPGHAVASKQVVATLSSNWTIDTSSGHDTLQEACFDGDNYTGNDGSSHVYTTCRFGAASGVTNDQTAVGAYLQFVFPRKVCINHVLFQMTAGNQEVYSGDNPTKYGKWHWEISKNGGTTWFSVGKTWWFRPGCNYMLAPQTDYDPNDTGGGGGGGPGHSIVLNVGSFGLPRDDSTGVPVDGVTHWRMVLDAEQPLAKFGATNGVFQIMFNLEDPGGTSLPLVASFTDDTDNALPVLTIVAGNPFRLAITDGDSDVINAALTVVANLHLTGSFSDGDSDILDGYGSFFPSTVVQTIINSKG